MNTFGAIKTKIEKASIRLYKNNKFKKFIKDFNDMVLENKDISEIYYIYDDLSSNKGINEDIVDDYVNESIEYIQILIDNNKKEINKVDNWVSSIIKETKNEYKSLDNIIYNTSIKNLDSVLTDKKTIKANLILTNKKEIKESVKLPLSSMLKIANDSLNREFKNISESDKKELNSLISMNKLEIHNEMKILKKNVISNLTNSIKESTENSLIETIGETIEKIRESKNDHYNLYKLRILNNNI